MSVSLANIYARDINIAEFQSRWDNFPCFQDDECEEDNTTQNQVYIDETGLEHTAYLTMQNPPPTERNEPEDAAAEDVQPCWRVLLDLMGQDGQPRNKYIEIAEQAANAGEYVALGLKRNAATFISNQVMMVAQQVEEPGDEVWSWIARKWGVVILRIVGERWSAQGDFEKTRTRWNLVSPGSGWGQRVVSDEALTLPDGAIRITLGEPEELQVKKVARKHKLDALKTLWGDYFPDNPPPKDYKKNDFCAGLAFLTPAFSSSANPTVSPADPSGAKTGGEQ